MLPWLWQLADEDVVNLAVPRQLAAATVAALRSVPPNEASAEGNNLQLLISALEWTWGSLLKQQQQAEEQKKVPPQQPPSGGGGPSGKPPLKVPSSAARGAGASPSRIPQSPRRSFSDQSPFQQGGTPPPQKVQPQTQQQQRLRPPSPSPGPRARSQSPLAPRALSPTPGSAGSHRPPRQRASMGEGLNEMQAQLDAMQAELYNSPRVRGGS